MVLLDLLLRSCSSQAWVHAGTTVEIDIKPITDEAGFPALSSAWPWLYVRERMNLLFLLQMGDIWFQKGLHSGALYGRCNIRWTKKSLSVSM